MNADKTTGIGVGMLLGAAVGVAVGMLYAPHSGKETRHMLVEKADEAKHKAEEMMQKARGKSSEY